jgi:hypothetical protein
MQRLGVLLAKAAIFWPCAGFCIWWAYSMRAQVHGGNHTFLQAVGLTIEMSFLTTVLTSIVWIASPRIHRQATWIGPAVKTAFETALVLILYTAAVLLWRDNWTPKKGMSDAAAFMPIVGHVNAEFFSEFGGLEYLVAVAPWVSVLSGVLTAAFDFLQKQRPVKNS